MSKICRAIRETIVVEAKFNTAGLTGAQRALKKQLGNAFTVSRTTLNNVGKASGIAAGAASGATGAALTPGSCEAKSSCK